MILQKHDILNLDRQYRVHLINHLSGVKGAHLIGTRSADGISNLAIFNSVCHVGANPASMGFLLRPLTVERNTYSNIMENGAFTINHISLQYIRDAHQSSAKFPKDVSEFDHLNFTEEYFSDFYAPFVKESHISIGLTFEEELKIALNGTIFMVGQIDFIKVKDEFLEETGHLSFGPQNSIGVSGLDTYYELNRIARESYAKAPK